MKTVTAFASRVLGSTPQESEQSAFRTKVVDANQTNTIEFYLTVIFLSESDNDTANIAVYLKSPLLHKGGAPFQQTIKSEKKGEQLGIALNVRMPFLSEGQGNYSYVVEINGSLDKEELLFELKYQDAPNPTTAPAQLAP